MKVRVLTSSVLKKLQGEVTKAIIDAEDEEFQGHPFEYETDEFSFRVETTRKRRKIGLVIIDGGE